MQVWDGWVDRWMVMDRAELWGTLALPHLLIFPWAPSLSGCPSSPSTAGVVQQRHVWEVTGDGQSYSRQLQVKQETRAGVHPPEPAAHHSHQIPDFFFSLITPKYMSFCVFSHTCTQKPTKFLSWISRHRNKSGKDETSFQGLLAGGVAHSALNLSAGAQLLSFKLWVQRFPWPCWRALQVLSHPDGATWPLPIQIPSLSLPL